MGYWRVRADGVLAGIERVCAESRRATQGVGHHRGGKLPVRAGAGLRLFQGKNQLTESRGNRAYPSGRRGVLLGVKWLRDLFQNSLGPLGNVFGIVLYQLSIRHPK